MEPSNLWKKRLDEVPELAPYLRKVALKWAKGNPLPKRMTLGSEPKEPSVRSTLDRIFGGRVFYRNGKVSVEIPDALRDDAVLAPLAALLDIQPLEIEPANDPSEIFQRLRLAHPEIDTEWLRSASEVERLLKNQPEQEQLLHQLLKTAAFLQTLETPTTLSKLGSMFFNDSKILRNGTFRKLLGGLMNAWLGADDTPENREIALQQFGVIDNPATTLVTLFGPIELIRKGKTECWLVDRFNANEPVTLNSYNLQDIDTVHLCSGFDTVITSENAAPFHELVHEQPQAIVVYTGGYPNSAVCRLLHLLALAGATCKHWGDTDPDGFMIAALIDRQIPTTLFRSERATAQSHGKPLSPNQLERGRRLLEAHPDFIFRKELERTLKEELWVEQEQDGNPQPSSRKSARSCRLP
ncbi:Wadjet anti-phage system protein JetD domain-containing protein [Pontiella sulfatireligans]|uniref:Wadjet protein JetD C-terminal domain-containing protein n=1 Tax=Pontiella sulfatireligans TaxID=2750658 RepID=A0A6C2UNK4_9BACT|nr:Wadjet anti-phage system protein JetD domain-containing protein [Pontiella sulfatireligans]VGO21845.1 hypothetical protein SCARR_03924 [Pontiella sulfatireligans]